MTEKKEYFGGKLYIHERIEIDSLGTPVLVRKKYRYTSKSVFRSPIDQTNLKKLRDTAMTKVVIVSKNHKETLKLIKNTFPELKKWSYKAENEFIYTSILNDKTKIIIVNNTKGNFEKLFDDVFDNKRIKLKLATTLYKRNVGESVKFTI